MKISNEKINDFLTKYVNNKSLYIIIIIGVCFMLLPDFGSKKKDIQNTEVYDAYSDEKRLSEILSGISGAGKVSVMITYYGTDYFDLAFEEKKNGETSEISAVSDNGTPFIKGKSYPAVKGVIAISEGAGNPYVKKALSDAISAVLNVPSYRICVLEGKERN